MVGAVAFGNFLDTHFHRKQAENFFGLANIDLSSSDRRRGNSSNVYVLLRSSQDNNPGQFPGVA